MTFLQKIFGHWLSAASRFRWAVIVGWLVLAGLSGFIAATRLGVDTDTSNMIAADAPYRIDDAAFTAAFPALDNQMVVLLRGVSPDAVDNVAARLSVRLESRPEIQGVFAAPYDPFFRRNGLLYLSVSELEDLLSRLNRAAPLIERLNADPSLDTFFDALAEAADAPDPTPQDAEVMDGLFRSVSETIEARLRGEAKPLSWQLLFRNNLDPPYQTVLTIEPNLDTSLLRPAKPVLAAIDQEVALMGDAIFAGVDIHVTGNPALRSDELLSVAQGIGFAFGVSGVLVLILLFVAYRSLSLALVTFFAVVISITITAGMAAVVFGSLNLVSVAFTVLMVGLGVDFAIHLMLHIRAEQAETNTVLEAFSNTARDIGSALILTVLSTAIAFFSFAPTRFEGMTQLGMISGIGVIVAFIVATTLLPAIVTFLPTPKRPTLGSGVERRRLTGHVVNGIGGLVIVLGVASVFVLPQARFDADPMALRDPGSPSVQAFNLLFDQPESRPYRLDFLAENEEQAQSMRSLFEALPEVDSARSLSSFIPKDQQVKLDLIEFAGIGISFAVAEGLTATPPEPGAVDRLLAALDGRDDASSIQLAASLERWQAAPEVEALATTIEADILRYWPDQLSRLRDQLGAGFVSLGDLPAEITDRYRGANGEIRVEITPADDVRDPSIRRSFVDAALGVAPNVTGSARNVLEAGDIIQSSMIQAGVVALLLVGLLLLFVLRDALTIGVMMVPLVLAALLTAATSALLNIPFNFANVIVVPLLIGIGIDSGIHLALRARRAIDLADLPHSVTARAVFFSAVTTIASFGSLSFSAHRGTASMGSLLMIAIGWTLVTTIFVLPLLMDRVRVIRGAGRSQTADR